MQLLLYKFKFTFLIFFKHKVRKYLNQVFVPLSYRQQKQLDLQMGGCGTAEKKTFQQGYEQQIKQGDSHLIAELIGTPPAQRIPWRNTNEKNSPQLKNEQRKLLDQSYQISDPGLLCPSSNKIVYACLHKNCIQTQRCLRCQKKSCPTCSKLHQFHGNQFHIEQLTKQLRLRAIQQKKLLNKLQQIQAKAVNQLKTKKITTFDKFNLKGLEERFAKIIDCFYVKRSTAEIRGTLLNELTQKLIQINEKAMEYSQQLVRQFQKQTFKIITTWQILENQIIQKFNAYTRSGIKKINGDESPYHKKTAASFQHPNNPHNKQFKIVESLTNIAITKMNSDDYYSSFVKNGVIPNNTFTTFKLHLTKINGKVILVGIASKSIFGVKEAYTHKQAITYASSNGSVWQNGDSRKGGRGVKDGEVLMVRVDTINWQVVWCVGGEQLAKTNIPDSMRRQGLYMVIMMLEKDGTVEYLT